MLCHRPGISLYDIVTYFHFNCTLNMSLYSLNSSKRWNAPNIRLLKAVVWLMEVQSSVNSVWKYQMVTNGSPLEQSSQPWIQIEFGDCSFPWCTSALPCRSLRPWPDTPARWTRRCSPTSQWSCWPSACSSLRGSLCILSGVETPSMLHPLCSHSTFWDEIIMCLRNMSVYCLIIKGNFL